MLGQVLIGIAVALLTAWACAALYFSSLPARGLRVAAALAFGLGTAAVFALLPDRGDALVWFLGAFAVVLAWWLAISPSHDRDWQPAVAVLPRAVLRGEQVSIHGVRNFDHRTLADFTPRYEDRVLDLGRLDRVDLVLSYWGGHRAIAHSMLSFGTADGARITVSVETRKRVGQRYSALAGFFKQYELIYVLGDERDLLRLRTNVRGEDVYLYPVVLSPEYVRRLFRAVLERVNRLFERPEFYDPLRQNCTTSFLALIEELQGSRVGCDVRFLLNGYLDQRAYERGRIPADESRGLPYEEMRARHRVSPAARACGDGPEFSERIREHLPGRTP